MRVLMIAPPGAGKGTQGKRIADHFGVPHIATGDLLREHVKNGTELGEQVKGHLDKGDLVPDDVVLDMVREALETSQRDTQGYVLDGLPRTMEQAKRVYEIAVELEMTAHVALHLQADEEELVRRLLARAEEEGRSDDTEDVIRRRLETYNEVTHPILDWYGERGILVSVDGMREPDEVTREVLAALQMLSSVIDHLPAEGRTAVDLTGLGSAFGADD